MKFLNANNVTLADSCATLLVRVETRRKEKASRGLTIQIRLGNFYSRISEMLINNYKSLWYITILRNIQVATRKYWLDHFTQQRKSFWATLRYFQINHDLWRASILQVAKASAPQIEKASEWSPRITTPMNW